MTNKIRLKKHLREEEGERLYPYRCPAGKLTIGIGRNIEDTGFTRQEKEEICGDNLPDKQFIDYLKEHGITKNESEMLLANDIKGCIEQAKHTLGKRVYKNLGDVRQEVIISMIFNMGIGSFRCFTQMIKNIKLGLHYKAYMEMQDSKYYRNSITHERAHLLSETYKNNQWMEND